MSNEPPAAAAVPSARALSAHPPCARNYLITAKRQMLRASEGKCTRREHSPSKILEGSMSNVPPAAVAVPSARALSAHPPCARNYLITAKRQMLRASEGKCTRREHSPSKILEGSMSNEPPAAAAVPSARALSAHPPCARNYLITAKRQMLRASEGKCTRREHSPSKILEGSMSNEPPAAAAVPSARALSAPSRRAGNHPITAGRHVWAQPLKVVCLEVARLIHDLQ